MSTNRILVCDRYRITQYFGGKNNHKGIDIVKYYSDVCPIKAHTEGEVVFCQTGQKNNKNATGNASYGNCVKIKHSNGYFTLYAHMKNVYVKKGQKVKTGQEIGYMGNTGKAYGAHLHFEVRTPKDVRINPQPYINSDLPNMAKYYQVYDKIKKKFLPKVKIGSDNYGGNDGNAISCFRTEEAEEYCGYDIVEKKWLPPVKSFSDYAGNKTHSLGAIAIKSKKLKYRVRLKNSKRYLPWVNGYNLKDFNNGYAGNKNEELDRIEIAYK